MRADVLIKTPTHCSADASDFCTSSGATKQVLLTTSSDLIAGSYYDLFTGQVTACTQGTYQDQTGQSSSSSCKSCAAGKYSSSGSTSSSSCINCPVGKYNTAGQGSCWLCSEGYYTNTLSGTVASSCNEC